MSSRADTGSKPCPHCGGRLDRGLAQHMTLGECDAVESTPTATKSTSDLPERYDELPVLEEHDERDHADHDLDERRALADELAETGVWC